ncbi:ATP-binding protein [Variovorax sp. LG9.2]|uniref:ATP-binding protein n=1 Tax=Variovorax sp. LG9.2 TaxID=3048626 RepID=UPI002B227304|nr:ATP-binding protein [Variovorax sp. LG9.2]MEB0058943.1 ATP-binding protein [Variovorax sp. LG9.2]
MSDACRPVLGDEVLRLLNDRPGMPWESLAAQDAPLTGADDVQVEALLAGLRASDRVKAGVKEKSNVELLEHYGLTDGPLLTHLGVLLIGSPRARARLGSAPVVQAIKYDERGAKIHKWTWDDYTLSPVQLVDAIWEEVSDFRETYELPDGLYRQKVPAYDKRVVRELIVNALVHRPYAQRGDIFLNLHPDRLEVCNPGLLPLGVTVYNILHASLRRNERLATLFHDLKLMEKEGSGFDLMYEVQLSQGRLAPVVEEGDDSVKVSVRRRIVRPEVIRLLADADATYQLRQRERITLGILAMSDGLTARELARQLEIADTDEVTTVWLGRLLDLGLVMSIGKTQGTRYFVPPQALKLGGVQRKTTLTRMVPHRLRALIVEDLSGYPGSSVTEVHRRTAPELAPRSVKRALDQLVATGQVEPQGEKRWRRYRLIDNGQIG